MQITETEARQLLSLDSLTPWFRKDTSTWEVDGEWGASLTAATFQDALKLIPQAKLIDKIEQALYDARRGNNLLGSETPKVDRALKALYKALAKEYFTEVVG